MVLREILPGIEPAETLITDLTPRLQRDCPRVRSQDGISRSSSLSQRGLRQPHPTDCHHRHQCLLPEPRRGLLSHPARSCSAGPRIVSLAQYLRLPGLYRIKNYDLAEKEFILAFYADSSYAQPLYNLACVCALTDRSSRRQIPKPSHRPRSQTGTAGRDRPRPGRRAPFLALARPARLQTTMINQQ